MNAFTKLEQAAFERSITSVTPAQWDYAKQEAHAALDDHDIADAGFVLHAPIKLALQADDLREVGRLIKLYTDNLVQRRTEYELFGKITTRAIDGPEDVQ